MNNQWQFSWLKARIRELAFERKCEHWHLQSCWASSNTLWISPLMVEHEWDLGIWNFTESTCCEIITNFLSHCWGPNAYQLVCSNSSSGRNSTSWQCHLDRMKKAVGTSCSFDPLLLFFLFLFHSTASLSNFCSKAHLKKPNWLLLSLKTLICVPRCRLSKLSEPLGCQSDTRAQAESGGPLPQFIPTHLLRMQEQNFTKSLLKDLSASASYPYISGVQ